VRAATSFESRLSAPFHHSVVESLARVNLSRLSFIPRRARIVATMRARWSWQFPARRFLSENVMRPPLGQREDRKNILSRNDRVDLVRLCPQTRPGLRSSVSVRRPNRSRPHRGAAGSCALSVSLRADGIATVGAATQRAIRESRLVVGSPDRHFAIFCLSTPWRRLASMPPATPPSGLAPHRPLSLPTRSSAPGCGAPDDLCQLAPCHLRSRLRFRR